MIVIVLIFQLLAILSSPLWEERSLRPWTKLTPVGNLSSMPSSAIDSSKLIKLIADAKASGGSELANYQLFIERLCNAYGLRGPDMAKEETSQNDDVFERKISFNLPDGTQAQGRIDCYKRGCFILEAKQSDKRKRRIAKVLETLVITGAAQAAEDGTKYFVPR